MELSLLADIGDFVGGIAVVVSLVYLAMQIRQNTRAVRGASYQHLTESLSDRAFRIGENPELSALWLRGTRRDPQLSEADVTRFELVLLALIRLWSNAFVQYRSGLLTEEQWRGFRVMPIAMLSSPGGRAWWPRGRALFGGDFAAFVDAELQQNSRRAAQQGAAADEPQRAPIGPW